MSTHHDENDGRHGFDFIFGDWTIRNHKLRDVADPSCAERVEFDTTYHAEPIFGGLAHFDRIMCAPDGTVALWDGGSTDTGAVTSSGTASAFAGFRFPPQVISVAVRWYLRYGFVVSRR
jgi:hypothetical protein